MAGRPAGVSQNHHLFWPIFCENRSEAWSAPSSSWMAIRLPLEYPLLDGVLLPSRPKTVSSSTVTPNRSLDGVTSPSSLREISFCFKFNRRLLDSAGFPSGVVVAKISFGPTFRPGNLRVDVDFPPRERDLRSAVQQGPPGCGAPRRG